MTATSDRAADQTAQLEQVVGLEMELLDPNMRKDPQNVRGLLHEYFSEFAASGLIYDRDNIDVAPVDDSGASMTVDRLEAELLAPGVVLVTYRAHRSQRMAWRSSVWLLTDEGWRLRHHQTTPVREA